MVKDEFKEKDVDEGNEHGSEPNDSPVLGHHKGVFVGLGGGRRNSEGHGGGQHDAEGEHKLTDRAKGSLVFNGADFVVVLCADHRKRAVRDAPQKATKADYVHVLDHADADRNGQQHIVQNHQFMFALPQNERTTKRTHHRSKNANTLLH